MELFDPSGDTHTAWLPALRAVPLSLAHVEGRHGAHRQRQACEETSGQMSTIPVSI